MKFRHLITIASSLLFALATGAAHAQSEKFTIAGGGGAKNGSTYSAMLGDLATACNSDDLTISEVTSSGAVANLASLRDNKVKAAIVQSDILFAAKLDNATSVASIKTIVALHPEAVHLIVRSDVKTEGGVTFLGKNIGGDKVVYNQAEDLKGRPVGAVGGSAISARIVSEQLRYSWVVTEFGSTSELLAALANHTVDAAVIVAGQPSEAVKKITGAFKLLPLRGNADTAVVYSPTKVQYPNLNGNRAVDTISEQALLVTRTWRSDEMLAKLATLRACFFKSLPTIQDREGTHAAWQDVKADEQGKWPWYELPQGKAAAAEPAAAATVATGPAPKVGRKKSSGAAWN